MALGADDVQTPKLDYLFMLFAGQSLLRGQLGQVAFLFNSGIRLSEVLAQEHLAG